MEQFEDTIMASHYCGLITEWKANDENVAAKQFKRFSMNVIKFEYCL